jgi:hypothetical protein
MSLTARACASRQARSCWHWSTDRTDWTGGTAAGSTPSAAKQPVTQSLSLGALFSTLTPEETQELVDSRLDF